MANRHYEVLCFRKLTDGREFGSIPLSSITPGLIRKYLDKRGEEAPIQANREIAFLSSAWNWGRERDMCALNPCIGVRRNKEKPRDRYITDQEYTFVYELALKTAPPYIPPANEIAYLCRARLTEILSLKDHYVREDGLFLERVKKSRSQVIAWSTRLQAAVTAVKKLEGVSFQRYLFHNQQGQKINDSTFKSAWQRLMKRAQEKGIKERFTFHDLKAKGVSDFDGDKKLASGHRSDSMVDVYDRKPGLVDATK